MNADSRREEIKKLYGSDIFNNKSLYSMEDRQIYAIYSQLQHSGKFEEYEELKQSYVHLFPNSHYEASRRANNMSIFELRQRIKDIIRQKEQAEPEGYQYTLFDWMRHLEGLEQEKENKNE